MKQTSDTKSKRPKSTSVRLWKEQLWPFLTKTKKRQLISTVLAVLFLIFLGLITRDVIKHNSVNRSLGKMQQALDATGVHDQIIFTNCFRADEKFGEGGKVCSLQLGDNFEAVLYERALEIVSAYHAAVGQSGDFITIRQPADPQRGNNFSGKISSLENGRYVHEQTRKQCYLSYDFTEKRSRIAFHCEDDYLYNHLLN